MSKESPFGFKEKAKYCPHCGGKLLYEVTFCPYCGNQMPSSKKWKIAVVLIAVALVAAYIVEQHFFGEHLTLTDIVFCTSKPSDRSYDQKPDATYMIGETVWMYLECYEFQCKKNNDYSVSFHIEVTIFDSQGKRMGELEQPINVSEKMEPEYVWFYFWIETDDFEGGEYTVHITVKDNVSGKRGTTKGSFFIPKRDTNAGDYILDELGGEIAKCVREENFSMCHIIYWENYRKIGDIWIYCYFKGTYEDYPFKIGVAKRKIVGGTYNNVAIYIGGDEEFLANVCDLYYEKFGFTCVEFKIP